MKVLIFTSTTCAPCLQLKPIMQRIQDAVGFEMEVVEGSQVTQALFERYGIRTVPTVVALNDLGERVGSFVGSRTEGECRAQLAEWGVSK